MQIELRDKKIDIKKLIRSFKFAGEGLVAVFKREQNFRVEVAVALVVIALMVYLQLEGLEVVILSMVIASVLTMEIINTVLEILLDMNTKRKSKSFKFLKDVMAAAVLINVFAAIVVGIFIFGQYL